MINWQKIDQEYNEHKPTDSQNRLEEDLNIIGIKLKKRFIEVSVEDEEDAVLDFDVLVNYSVDQVSKSSSEFLKEQYDNLRPPAFDDTVELAKVFIENTSKKFRKIICTELWEDSGRDMVTLIPIIVAVLSLPPTYVALAVPISVVLAKTGLRSYCEGYEYDETSRQILETKLEVHRIALKFLEGELTRYEGKQVPESLREAFEKENKKLNQIVEKLNKAT